MGVHRRLGAQRLQHHHLARGVRQVVLAPHHVGDAHVEVVHRDGQVVEGAAVGARDHEVVDRGVRESSPRRGSRRSRPSRRRRAPSAARRPRPRRRGRRRAWRRWPRGGGRSAPPGRSAPRPSRAPATAGRRGSAPRSRAWSARGRCPRSAAPSRRPASPAASCTVPSARRRCAAPRSATARTSLSHVPRVFNADRRPRVHRRRTGEGPRAGCGDRGRRDPDLGSVAPDVEAHVVEGRGRGRVLRADGRRADRRRGDPRDLPDQLRLQGQGDPAKVDRFAGALAADRRPDRRRRRGAPPGVDRGRAARGGAEARRRGAAPRPGGVGRLPAAAGGHRRSRQHARPHVRGAGRADRPGGRPASGSACAWTPVTCSRAASTSARRTASTR